MGRRLLYSARPWRRLLRARRHLSAYVGARWRVLRTRRRLLIGLIAITIRPQGPQEHSITGVPVWLRYMVQEVFLHQVPFVEQKQMYLVLEVMKRTLGQAFKTDVSYGLMLSMVSRGDVRALPLLQHAATPRRKRGTARVVMRAHLGSSKLSFGALAFPRVRRRP